MDNIPARESSRGKRRHGGLVEECVGVDGEILSTVILPTMNVSRRCMDGTTQESEVLNKSQIYVNYLGTKLHKYVKYSYNIIQEIVLCYIIFIKLKIQKIIKFILGLPIILLEDELAIYLI